MDMNKKILLPGPSSTSQTNIPTTHEANSSPFELYTPQSETLLSSSENSVAEVDSTHSSSYQSSSSEEATVKQMKRKLSMYNAMLDEKQAEHNPEHTKNKKPESFPRDVYSRQMLLHQSINFIENCFERAMHEANMQGYVFGIILEDDSVISGSSPSLRKWWEETVRFDINGPVAVDRYYMENQLDFNPNKDATTPTKAYDLIMELGDATLGSLLSALMNRCDPPQRKYPLEKNVPPPWWPTGNEPWWDQIAIQKDEEQPPYRKPHDLRKMWKAAVVIAIIKHMAPAFDKLARVVKQSTNIQGKMNAKEMKTWNSVLEEEAKLYSRDHPDVPLSDLLASFSSQGIVLSDGTNSSYSNNNVRGFQSQFHLPTLLPEQQLSSLTPSQQQQHHQVASMLNLPTEQRMMMRYTCDHPRCPHHNQAFGFPTVELRDQHLWSCVFRNTGGQFQVGPRAFPTNTLYQGIISPQFPPLPQAPGAPPQYQQMGPVQFQTSTLYQGITSQQFTPMTQVAGAPSQYQQMDPLQIRPVIHQPPNHAYGEVTVAFSEMGPQQQNLSFQSFGGSDYSTIPNDGQQMGSGQSAFPGQGFFNGEGSRGNTRHFF